MSPSSPAETPLSKVLREQILADGPMRFDDWMHACLYHPEHGYYSDPARVRTGRGGDFFTSVSVGAMFGRALALAFVPIWEDCGRPEEFWLIEFGAEDGQLAVDILQAAEAMGGSDYAKAIRYGIVEPVNAKQDVQRESLVKAGLETKAEWLEGGFEPAKPVGVVFGNEVVDAQRIELVIKLKDGLAERCVAVDEAGNFIWKDTPLAGDHRLVRYFNQFSLGQMLDQYPEGYVAEARTGDFDLMMDMRHLVERGAVLMIDYGFDEVDLFSFTRTAGTLQCYHQHQKSDDPLAFPGEQDITAHVNFSQLAREGKKHGLEPLAWLTQERVMAGLLGEFGKHPDVPRLLEGLPDSAKAMRQLQTLMHPEVLGAKFKWLWMTRNLALPEAEVGALRFARASELDSLF